MRDSRSQIHDPLNSQLSYGSKIDSDVETQTYSNHTQPRTSILSSQLPKQHMDYGQEMESDAMNKKTYRPVQTLKGHTSTVNTVAFSPI